MSTQRHALPTARFASACAPLALTALLLASPASAWATEQDYPAEPVAADATPLEEGEGTPSADDLEPSEPAFAPVEEVEGEQLTDMGPSDAQELTAGTEAHDTGGEGLDEAPSIDADQPELDTPNDSAAEAAPDEPEDAVEAAEASATEGEAPAAEEQAAAQQVPETTSVQATTAPQKASASTAEANTTEYAPQASDEKAPTKTPPAKTYSAGLHKVGGKLRYFAKKTTDASGYVTSGHYVKSATQLYDIRKGVAKLVNLAGRNYYRCADGYIFFSASKASNRLATGKRGWVTSSAYGVSGGRYYFRKTSEGYLFTKYGFSMAGKTFGVLTGKKGNARTSNYVKGNRLYLVRSSGRVLALPTKSVKAYGYTNEGFVWAKSFGDKICSETFNTRELYFLHKTTSGSAYLKGAYYVKYNKGRIKYEKAGDGLLYESASGKTATYQGAHANTSFGFVLRAVNDRGHNGVTVKGKMPVVYKNKVYLADANGQLKQQTSKDVTKKQKQATRHANLYLSKKKGTYGITVNKGSHDVFLWYCNGRKWLPMFVTPCTTGNNQTTVIDGKTIHYITPNGKTRTYDHQLYFANCAYYATGYRPSEDSGWHLHSTLYHLSSGTRSDSVLRKNASHGCVRVNINYARYVYKYVPLRTQFYVY